MKRAVVTGIAHAVPPKVLTNDDLAKMVETSDEWIAQRTGIRERHICEGVEEGTYSLSVEASKKALAKAGLGPEDVDLIIVGTVSGDFLWPATACHVQNALGVPTHAAAFDISAACTGFVYGVATAAAFLESGAAKRALVVGMDCLVEATETGRIAQRASSSETGAGRWCWRPRRGATRGPIVEW